MEGGYFRLGVRIRRMRASPLTRKQIQEKRADLEKRISTLQEAASRKRPWEKEIDEYDIERLRAELSELDDLIGSDELK
jgi:hypothetical protein